MPNFMNDDRWLIITDLDGTFLKSPITHDLSNTEIKSKNIEVVNKLIDMGHKVAIVTGRPWKDSKVIYEKIGLTSIIGNYNGAVIHYPGREDEFSTLSFSINKKLLKHVINDDILEGKTSSVIIESKVTTYVDDLSTRIAHLFVTDKGLKVKEFTNLNEIEGSVMSVLIGIDLSKTAEPEKILQTMQRKYGSALFFRYWDYSKEENPWLMLEINQKTSNKGTAMRLIAEYYNIPMTRTIAFGDGLNDREMLVDAAVGVAMKNASRTVKAFANDTTDLDNNEAGVGDYLEKFFKI